MITRGGCEVLSSKNTLMMMMQIEADIKSQCQQQAAVRGKGVERLYQTLSTARLAVHRYQNVGENFRLCPMMSIVGGLQVR